MEYDLKLWHKLVLTWLVLGPLTFLHVMANPIATVGPVTLSNGGIPWLVPAGLGILISLYDILDHWVRRRKNLQSEQR